MNVNFTPHLPQNVTGTVNKPDNRYRFEPMKNISLDTCMLINQYRINTDVTTQSTTLRLQAKSVGSDYVRGCTASVFVLQNIPQRDAGHCLEVDGS